MKCRVCGSECRHQFSHTILHGYACGYFFCPACGFLQTEEPYWLEEAYKSAITHADTGLVYRNVSLSKIVSTLLFFCFDRHGRYLDMAGGYGMFTRLMRDIGFDFFWSDMYCENLLARGFEVKEKNKPLHAVTAFEVLEHVPKPVAFLSDALREAQTRTIIFSTELFSGTPPAPGDWWYYAFPTGQHIAFYQLRTLQTIAARLGLRCYSNGTVHMLTDRAINPALFRLLTTPRLGLLLSPFLKRAMVSKMISDSQTILASGKH